MTNEEEYKKLVRLCRASMALNILTSISMLVMILFMALYWSYVLNSVRGVALGIMGL